jgi:hypothetical protein
MTVTSTFDYPKYWLGAPWVSETKYYLEHVNRWPSTKSYGRKATNRALALRKRLRGQSVGCL